jgi:hypothetical protein
MNLNYAVAARYADSAPRYADNSAENGMEIQIVEHRPHA